MEKKMKLTKEELIAAYSAKNKVNKFIRDRVYGMVMAENEEIRENKLSVHGDDILTEHMGNMEGDVEILGCDDLEDLDGTLSGINGVRYTYSGYWRGDYTDSICFPFECFEAETDKEAYEIYVARCLEQYNRRAKEEALEKALEKAKKEKAKEDHDRREYERLKKKFEAEEKTNERIKNEEI